MKNTTKKQKSNLSISYRAFFRAINLYWRAYGGLSSIISSPYAHLSILLTAISYNTWTSTMWANTPIGILPSLIGFSIGGFAIWLTLGEESFLKKISKKDLKNKDDYSLYIRVNASFIHFIVLQLTALILCLLHDIELAFLLPYEVKIALVDFCPIIIDVRNFIRDFGFPATAYFLFMYALTSAFSASFALFSISNWLDSHRSKMEKDQARKSTRISRGRISNSRNLRGQSR